MASDGIQIKVSEDGTRVVIRNMDALAKSSDGVSRAVQAAIKTLQQLGRAGGTSGLPRELESAARASRQLEQGLGRVRFASARQILQDLSNVAQVATFAARTIGLMANAMRSVASFGWDTTRGLADRADQFTTLRNRLRTVVSADEASGLDGLTSKLFGRALEARAEIGSMVELYVRMRSATRELGVSQQDIMRVTESIAKTAAMSGASTSEAAGALRQFSQAMSSGVLRGEELNSVLEQMPALADIIARELNVTRGQLRALGQDGKLTSDAILKAILNAGQQIDQQFAQMAPTISQALQVAENQWIRFIGRMDDKLVDGPATLSGLVARAINEGAMKGDLLLEAVLVRLRQEFTSLDSFLKTIAASGEFANISFEDLLLGAAGLLDEFIAWVRDGLKAAFDYVLDAVEERLTSIINAVIDALNSALNTIGISIPQIGEAAAPAAADARSFSIGDVIFGTPINRYAAAAAGQGGNAGFPSILDALFGTPINRYAAVAADQAGNGNQGVVLSSMLTTLQEMLGIQRATGDKLTQSATADEQATRAVQDSGIATREVADTLNTIEGSGIGLTGTTVADLANGTGQAVATAMAPLIGSLGTAINTALASRPPGVPQAALPGTLPIAPPPPDSLAGGNDAQAGFFTNQMQQLLNVMKNLRTERDGLEAGYDDLIRKHQQIGLSGRQAFSGINDAATGLGNTMDQFLGGVFSNLENALTQFVTTGKLDFKSLINAMLADLARLVIQMLIIRPLMGFFGGFFGGIFGFSQGGFVGGPALGIPGFAQGGLVYDAKSLIPGYATGGGIVAGFGGSTADSMLARLSAGEFVINAGATRRNRSLLETINRTGYAPASMYAGASSGAVTVVSNIAINMHGGGANSDPKQMQAMSNQLDATVRKTIVEVLTKEQRPGGVLHGTQKRG